MATTWMDHGIDFVVIFLADLAAAYVAFRYFELRKEADARAHESIAELCRVSALLKDRYSKMLKGFATSSDSTATGLSSDITDLDREFANFDSNYKFWSFKNSGEFQKSYKTVKSLKEKLPHQTTVGVLKTKLNELISELDSTIEKSKKYLDF
jgi:hypothetical protein